MGQAMKKKSVSKVAKGRLAKAMVLRGSKAKTVGGLTAKDLTRNSSGKIVSKKLSAKSKKSPWIAACKKARAALKIKGFCAIKKGSPLCLKAKEFYKLLVPSASKGLCHWACGRASSRCGDFRSC